MCQLGHVLTQRELCYFMDIFLRDHMSATGPGCLHGLAHRRTWPFLRHRHVQAQTFRQDLPLSLGLLRQAHENLHHEKWRFEFLERVRHLQRFLPGNMGCSSEENYDGQARFRV